MQIPSPALDEFLERQDGDKFLCLFDKEYPLNEVGELFRAEYEIFRGELIKLRLEDSVIEESGIGVMTIKRTHEKDPYFQVKFHNVRERNRRFYNHCLRRFGQE